MGRPTSQFLTCTDQRQRFPFLLVPTTYHGDSLVTLFARRSKARSSVFPLFYGCPWDIARAGYHEHFFISHASRVFGSILPIQRNSFTCRIAIWRPVWIRAPIRTFATPSFTTHKHRGRLWITASVLAPV